MEIYTERIAKATSMEDLNSIVEDAADDDRITNEVYCRVFDACVERVRSL